MQQHHVMEQEVGQSLLQGDRAREGHGLWEAQELKGVATKDRRELERGRGWRRVSPRNGAYLHISAWGTG